MIRTPVYEPLGTIGAISQVHHQLTDESASLILAAKPAVFSLALGDPGNLVERAIHEILPAQEIVRRLVGEADEALKEATRCVS